MKRLCCLSCIADSRTWTLDAGRMRDLGKVSNNMKFDINKLKALIPPRVKELLENERVRPYLVLGTAAGILLMYLLFAVIPNWSFFVKTSREIEDLKTNIDLVDSRIQRIDVLAKNKKVLSEELESYSGGLPSRQEIPEFLEELSGTAKTSGVKILSITPARGKDADKDEQKTEVYYKDVPIVITAQSGYHELGHFISNLEESKRFITIEDLSIKSDLRTPREHSVTINLKTYVAD